MQDKILYKAIIYIEPRTKKNSSRIVHHGKGYIILPSKEFVQYQADCGYFLKPPNKPIKQKCNIKATYYRRTKRKVDISNLHSALHDILTHYGVIADDCCKIVVGTDGSRVLIDKTNPRTEIVITELDETTGFED